MTDQTKDDPRENGWAERRIAELEGRIHSLELGGTSPNDAAKMKWLEDHVLSLEAQFNEITEDRDLEPRPILNVAGFDPRPDGVPSEAEIDRAARGVDLDWERWKHGGVVPKTAVEKLIAEGPFVAGGVIPDWLKTSQSINTIRAHIGAQAAAIELARRGLVDSAAGALNQAEARIRSYMDGHFSTATIEGVVSALRGDAVMKLEDDVTKDQPMVLGETPCPGPLWCWASERNEAHKHDRLGVVHPKGL